MAPRCRPNARRQTRRWNTAYASPLAVVVVAAATVLVRLVEQSHAASQVVPGIPVNSTIDVDMNSEIFVPLQAAVPLTEPKERGGQLNWPIYISKDTFGNEGVFDDLVVDNIAVTIRGLYHEWAGDLTMVVSHEDTSSTLSENRGGKRQLGRPAPRAYESISAAKLKRSMVADLDMHGQGFDYRFADLVGDNLAAGCEGSQSSTMSGNETAAWRATDGDIVSSGMATHTENNPWYQVDLNATRDIGTVVLWTPDPENQINEVQIVKSTGLVTLGGSFRLALTHNGFTEITDVIQHNAVPSVLYEDDTSNELGTGDGESMQSKIQGLNNVGLVAVTRSDPDRTGGYEWTITFLTEHTDLNPLEVYANNLSAGPLRLPEDQIANVTVTTIVDGTRNTFYNANMRSGVVLVSDTPFGDVDLAGARAIASFEQNFDIRYSQRQINIPMPTNTRGRYVRVGLRQGISYLSIAELLVFEEELYSFEVFDGGSPMPEGSYAPELAFSDIFGGAEIYGQWVLSITDSVQSYVVHEQSSRRREVHHGVGAVSDWVLQVTPRNRTSGEVLSDAVMTFHVDLSATILTLPKYGTLYEAEAFVKGELIEAVVGMEIFTGPCSPIDCAHKFGLGNILSTSPLGSVAAANSIHQYRKVVYVPQTNFRGTDTFTYRLNVGTRPDPRVGTVTLNVKRCRIDCMNDRLFGIRPAIDETLVTPWDDRVSPAYPPDKVLQPEKYGARLWNDPYCVLIRAVPVTSLGQQEYGVQVLCYSKSG
ncbi:Hypothetical Protein FCC1311_046532 [Hondaea fermentalgiana]|uniref:Uncharacterized protein n=1 Tax=Hondaea fermentalgiana TaxID=2315210 RepID=A0A2R5GBR4_9STRA|nr:Hypothetical Protein FCC1311_046532 [Hondaea fermentalgiana]|eukprot:GBG28430.1 Hypothetical Protein FCC1311_046532 [Hondaea fermentalgiana]